MNPLVGREKGMTKLPIANTAMEGAGFYNRNSSLQAAGIELALPLLDAAAQGLQVDGEAPLVIADFGSSQGRNSMRPMRLAIETLRRRFGPDRPIEVIHTDLPSNDFASLFRMLDEEETSYLSGQPRVFPSAVGRSYFAPILPPARVHLGWNSWTLHWMSRNPIEVHDHVLAICSASAAAREAVRHQLADDWQNFLAARAVELAPRGRLVSLSMGATTESHGWEWILGELWHATVELADEGLISANELNRFTVPVGGRTTADLAAPFAAGEFEGLSLDHAEVMEAPDPFWDEYRRTGDVRQFARKWAGMVQAVCGPVALAAFASRADGEALAAELFLRLEARVAAAPQRHEHFVAIAAVRKTAD
jgi:hypothetical protein